MAFVRGMAVLTRGAGGVLCLLLLVSSWRAVDADDSPDTDDGDEKVHIWGSTLALLALQASPGGESCALATLERLQEATLLALNGSDGGGEFSKAAGTNAVEDFLGNQQTPSGNTPSTKLFNGLLTVTDPRLFVDSSIKIRNSAVGAVLQATGANYDPCLVVSSAVGAGLFAQGILINPSLLTTSFTGAVVGSIGLLVQPALISIGANDNVAGAIALSVAPSLIKVNPIVTSDTQTLKDLSGTPDITVHIPLP